MNPTTGESASIVLTRSHMTDLQWCVSCCQWQLPATVLFVWRINIGGGMMPGVFCEACAGAPPEVIRAMLVRYREAFGAFIYLLRDVDGMEITLERESGERDLAHDAQVDLKRISREVM